MLPGCASLQTGGLKKLNGILTLLEQHLKAPEVEAASAASLEQAAKQAAQFRTRSQAFEPNLRVSAASAGRNSSNSTVEPFYSVDADALAAYNNDLAKYLTSHIPALVMKRNLVAFHKAHKPPAPRQKLCAAAKKMTGLSKKVRLVEQHSSLG